ncbi:MAG: chitinase [Micromonosporaceae bacterium]|nr:chitinase [Micromonosporaceae bacterium]
MRRRRIIIGTAMSAMLAAAGTAVVLTSVPASAAAVFAVAPYVDLSAGSADMLDTAIAQGGVNSYTASFIIGSGCTAIWGDTLGINNSTVNVRIARAQAAGAQTIISFGGAGGAELAQSCTDVNALTAQYQSVITKYRVNHLDFDIEGAAIADPTSINRRYQAIRNLEAANPGLNVSVTIPVLEGGPTADGTNFLRAAVTNGARINLINAMVMDYGHPVTNMATAAQTGATGTLAAARSAGINATFANIGVTPMIGNNDSAGEVVSLANARTIVSWANANGIGRLAFWSIGRDQPCPGGGVSPNCSGLGGAALDFTRAFTGGATGTPPNNPPPTTPPTTPPTNPPPTNPPPGTGATTWVANHAYTVGNTVTFSGVSYRCLQSHTSLVGWEPPNVPALWQRV